MGPGGRGRLKSRPLSSSLQAGGRRLDRLNTAARVTGISILQRHLPLDNIGSADTIWRIEDQADMTDFKIA